MPKDGEGEHPQLQSESLRKKHFSRESDERNARMMSASRSPVRDNTLGSLNFRATGAGQRSGKAGAGSDRDAIQERHQSEMEALYARQLDEKERVIR